MSNRYYYQSAREPSLRQEFFDTMDGTATEVSKARPALLRKARKDANGHIMPCPCVDKNTGESDKDTLCPFCQGAGYFWDETWIECFRVHQDPQGGLAEKLIAPGLVLIHQVNFYIKATETLTVESDDRIVEVELDLAGLPVIPHRRRELYRIGVSIDFRADNGKLEYWKCECYTEKRKYLNGDEDK